MFIMRYEFVFGFECYWRFRYLVKRFFEVFLVCYGLKSLYGSKGNIVELLF